MRAFAVFLTIAVIIALAPVQSHAALTAAQKKTLNNIGREMNRKGFALGTMLNTAVEADIVLAQADADLAQAGKLDPTGSNIETSTTNAGAISVSKLQTNISSAASQSRTLAAPGAGNVGQIKIITMTVDGGDVTLAGTNITGEAATTATFDDVGDYLILYALSATKWIILAKNVTFA